MIFFFSLLTTLQADDCCSCELQSFVQMCCVLVTYVGYLSLIVLKLVFYRLDMFPQEAYLHFQSRNLHQFQLHSTISVSKEDSGITIATEYTCLVKNLIVVLNEVIVQRVQALLPPSVYYITKGSITNNLNFVKTFQNP